MFHLVRPILSQLFYTTASMLRVLGNLRVSCITEPSKSFLCDATDEKYTSAIIWRSLARLASVFSKWALPVSQQLYSATLRSAQTKGQAQCTRERMGHTLSTLQSSLTLVHVLTNKPGTQQLVKHGQDLLLAGLQGLQDFHVRKKASGSSTELTQEPTACWLSEESTQRCMRDIITLWELAALERKRRKILILRNWEQLIMFLHTNVKGGRTNQYGKAY